MRIIQYITITGLLIVQTVAPIWAQDQSMISNFNVSQNATKSAFKISFVLKDSAQVTAQIFNRFGQEIDKPAHNRLLPADTIHLSWVPDTSRKREVYLLMLKADTSMRTCKLVFMRSVDTCQAPLAGFSYASKFKTVHFYNTSSKADHYEWRFGNGISDTAFQPTYKFDSFGIQKVCLKAYNHCDIDTFCRRINLKCVLPKPNFTYGIRNLHVNFFNHSKYGSSYKWYFGDGDSARTKGPGHRYNQDSAYHVCLKAINECGSNDTCKLVDLKASNSIINDQQETSINLFPNPVSKGQKLNVNGETIGQMRLKLYKLSGELVKEMQLAPKTSVSLNNINSGLYHYSITKEQQKVKIGRLVVLP